MDRASTSARREDAFAALAPEARIARIERLASSALDRWRLGDARVALLHHRENAVFRVDATTGDRFALRVHRPGYQTRASVQSELAWTDALREAGIDSPASVVGADGERVQEVAHTDVPDARLCVLFRWVEGTPLAGTDTLAAFELLGTINAKLHRHAEHWTPPPGFVRQRWDLDGMLGEHALWGRFGDLAALTGAERALLSRAADAVRSDLARHGTAPDRFGLIHADLMPDNVLVHAGVPQLIDFDDCGFGWFLYDLATLLLLHEGRPRHDAARQAWLRGYRGVRALDDAQLERLPALTMARRLVVLGWLHTRRDTDVAQAATGTLVQRTCIRAEEFLAARIA